MSEHMNNINLHLKICMISLILMFSTFAAAQTINENWPVISSPYYQGFEQKVSGVELDFLPGLTNGQVALLARANKGENEISFKTSLIENDYQDEIASFVWSTSMSAALTKEPPGQFDFYFNDQLLFTFENHQDSSSSSWVLTSEQSTLHFVTTEYAKGTSDAFGYMFLNVPKSSLNLGERQTIRIVGHEQESMDWHMPFGVPIVSRQDVLAEPAIAKTTDGPKQRVRVEVYHAGAPSTIQFKIDKEFFRKEPIKPGKKIFYLKLPPVQTEKIIQLEVSIAGHSRTSHSVKLSPVRNYEVYFLPHSHVDIGFTHSQDDVEKLQWRNFDLGIELAEKTKDYPDGAQFKWNAEITWAIEGYLEQASPEKKERFLEAVRKGWIGLDALIASQLTGLQREEEMMNNQRFAIELSEKYGFDINTAMISDVPGYSWGTVESLAKSGVNYFSSGPNHMPHLPHGGYQVGYTMEAWGDIPFYWASASGKEKVLFWMTSHGYSWFHSWSVDILSKAGGDPILRHLSELENQGYPYDLVQLRYTVGNDNGPPDETMPDFIREWNDTYEWPKMRIATNKEMMVAFEERYGDQLPVYKGDFTPYWEDGAASSALETGLNRKSADRITQAETLWALTKSESIPADQLDDAWRNVLLYSEHTWGANISKSQPDSEFTKSLWDVKQAFALDAAEQSKQLLQSAMASSEMEVVDAVQVFNTSSWTRTELVTIPADLNIKGLKIIDEDGNQLAAQKLSSGEVVFVATDVPAWGAKKYFIKKGNSIESTQMNVEDMLISNEKLAIQLNPATGDIAEIKTNSSASNTSLIKQADTLGFNAYWYTGLNKSNPRKQNNARFEITEKGPVVNKIKVYSDAPGSEGLTREIMLVTGSHQIFITNTVDKVRVIEDENVRFSFPFDIPDGKVRIDIPWATMQPEKDQLKGANKNFYSVQRWVDISNENIGVTLAPVEAPLLEIGNMNGQNWMADMDVRPWIKKYEPSTTLFSWTMNNAWFVNYKAFQEGLIPFHYVLKTHGKFDDLETKKWGMALTQPLIVKAIGKKEAVTKSLINIKEMNNTVVTSVRRSKEGTAYIVRLFNPTDTKGNASFSSEVALTYYNCESKDRKSEKIQEVIALDPWEVKTIWIEK
ncbi:MAG: alpha-mannosidase [Marinoscillum sp.]|jgi:hypothetical protein